MMKLCSINFEVFMSGRKYLLLRHLVVQMMLFILSLNAFGTSSDIFIFNAIRFRLFAIFYGVLNVVCYLNMYVLVPNLFLKNKIYQYMGCIFVCVTVFLFLLIIGQPRMEECDILPMNPALMITNIIASFINICIVIISTTTLMLFRFWTEEQRKVRELEVTTRNAELELLKSQINPHFLFNTLNNANMLLKGRGKEASFVLFKLEDLIRYQLDECNKERVYLKSDIQFLNDYLNLEKIRRDSFDFCCIVKGDIENIKVPPLMFIPFVENAVKHNPDSGARVDMWFTINGNELNFVCQNMKSDGHVDRRVGGIGLNNIRRRLELIYPKSHDLQVIDTHDSFKVILNIDNITKRNL